jgi:uncharacterized protein YndB with AHSA1/START domain
MRLDLALDTLLPHSVDRVWSQLTTAEAISGWLMETVDFRPEPGARFRMKTQHMAVNGWVEAEVLELDPARRMVWAWDVNDGSAPTTGDVRAGAGRGGNAAAADARGRDRSGVRRPPARRVARPDRRAEEETVTETREVVTHDPWLEAR